MSSFDRVRQKVIGSLNEKKFDNPGECPSCHNLRGIVGSDS